jgi:hypothetical protein
MKRWEDHFNGGWSIKATPHRRRQLCPIFQHGHSTPGTANGNSYSDQVRHLHAKHVPVEVAPRATTDALCTPCDPGPGTASSGQRTRLTTASAAAKPDEEDDAIPYGGPIGRLNHGQGMHRNSKTFHPWSAAATTTTQHSPHRPGWWCSSLGSKARRGPFTKTCRGDLEREAHPRHWNVFSNFRRLWTWKPLFYIY